MFLSFYFFHHPSFMIITILSLQLATFFELPILLCTEAQACITIMTTQNEHQGSYARRFYWRGYYHGSLSRFDWTKQLCLILESGTQIGSSSFRRDSTQDDLHTVYTWEAIKDVLLNLVRFNIFVLNIQLQYLSKCYGIRTYSSQTWMKQKFPITPPTSLRCRCA